MTSRTSGTRARLLIAGLALALTVGAASGQAPVSTTPPARLAEPTSPVPPKLIAGRDNAALAYYRAFDLMNAEDGKLVGEILLGSGEAEFKLTPAARELLLRNQSFVNALMKAASIKESDWGIRWEEGFMALLPHLGQMRRSARVLVADARRLIADGEPIEAAKRLQTVTRMAGHIRDDGLLISSLVSAAMLALTQSASNTLMNRSELTPEAARIVLNSLREFERNDLVGLHSAVKNEGRIATDWVRDTFSGPNAGKELAEMFGEFNQEKDRSKALTGLDAAALQADLKLSAEYYARVDAAWGTPGCLDTLKALEADVLAGKYGVMAQVISPAFQKSYTSELRVRSEFAATIKRLELVTRGEDPNGLADPYAQPAKAAPAQPAKP